MKAELVLMTSAFWSKLKVNLGLLYVFAYSSVLLTHNIHHQNVSSLYMYM